MTKSEIEAKAKYLMAVCPLRGTHQQRVALVAEEIGDQAYNEASLHGRQAAVSEKNRVMHMVYRILEEPRHY